MSNLLNQWSRAERGNLRLEKSSNTLAIIASSVAILGSVISIGLGFWVSILNSDVAHLNATIDKLNDEIATSRAQLEARQETIEDLRQENGELRAALPPSIAPEQVPSARNTGTVTLAAGGDAIDLNSTEANFGAGANMASSDSLRYKEGALHAPWTIFVVQLKDGIASYENCAVATGYAPVSTIEPHRLADGRVCVRTQSGNYARITVESHTADEVTLTIMTWDKPL